LLKLPDIKKNNLLAVLEVLRCVDSISRVELAATLGCDGTTITRACRELLEIGLLQTIGSVDATVGRPRELVALYAGWKQAIGIALDPKRISGVLTDLKGAILVREQVFLRDNVTREEFLEALSTVTNGLLKSCSKEKLLGIEIAAFGTFSGENKVLDTVAGLPTIEDLDLADFFNSMNFGVPEITDITICRIMHELWFKNHGTKGNFMLFNIGAGLGCAVAIDKKIVFSKYAHAGEFGHLICLPDGELCGCGRRGCLETLCSIDVLSRNLSRAMKKKVTFKDVVELYETGHGQATEVVNEATRWLGIAMANQINMLNPDEIVIAGELLALGRCFYDVLCEIIDSYVFPVFRRNLTIYKADDWKESASLGAASQLVRKIFEGTSVIQ